jgi:hypothetical protein
MVRRFHPHVPAALVIVLVAIGCSNGSNKLPGAVYASHVPVYAPATADGQMGGTSYGDSPEETSEGQSWFFNTDRPMEEVLAFYEKNLPGWKRSEERTGDGLQIMFTNVPEGAEKDEYVQVIVYQGRVQISESCRPGKIKN